jgi:hypothetical protein
MAPNQAKHASAYRLFTSKSWLSAPDMTRKMHHCGNIYEPGRTQARPQHALLFHSFRLLDV